MSFVKKGIFSEVPESFKFEWKLEDVFLGSESIQPLDSPVFRIRFLDESTWFIRLLPDRIRCEWHRCEDLAISRGRTFKVSTQVQIKEFTSGEVLVEWSNPEQQIDSETSHISFDDGTREEDPPSQINTLIVLFLVQDLTLPLSPGLNVLEILIPSIFDLSLSWSDNFNPPSSFLPSGSQCFSRSEIMQKTVKWTMDKIKHGEQRVLHLEPAIEKASALRLIATNESGKLYLEVEKTDYQAEMSALQMVIEWAEDQEYFKILFRLDEQHVSHCFDTGIQLDSIEEDSFLLKLDIKEVKDRGCHPNKLSRFLTRRQSSGKITAEEVGKDMLKMYTEKIGSDVKLKTHCGRVFHAHRDFLAMRSPKFKSLLQEAINHEESLSSSPEVLDNLVEITTSITQKKTNELESELKVNENENTLKSEAIGTNNDELDTLGLHDTRHEKKENFTTQNMIQEQSKTLVEDANSLERLNVITQTNSKDKELSNDTKENQDREGCNYSLTQRSFPRDLESETLDQKEPFPGNEGVSNVQEYGIASRDKAIQQNLDSKFIELDITDLDAETLEFLLIFLYSASLKKLELHTLLKVYEAGNLYHVSALQNLCRGRLERFLDTKAAAAKDILAYALKYDDRQLIKLSRNII